jgi:cobyrinic acid a,c-diamide synthase
VRVEVLARLELVFCAAIRALGMTVFGHIQEDTRMATPQRHTSLLARAENTALRIQICGGEFDGLTHTASFQTWVSQWAYLGLRPFTISKNAL